MCSCRPARTHSEHERPVCDGLQGVTRASGEALDTLGELSWVSLFSCSSHPTVPPLVQFHGAGSFFRPSGTFLLFPRIQVGEVFVIQLGQRMRESCCLLGVRITLLFCRCLPRSKGTQNFFVVHGAIPRLRYDGPAELRGTQFHLLCISSGCPQCGEYHDLQLELSAFLFQCARMLFAFSGAGSRHTSRCRDASERDRRVDLFREVVTRPDGSVEVLTNPTKAAHGSVPVLRSC